MPPFRRLCTDCGVSRSANPKQCAQACQFIAPDYPRWERVVHGAARSTADPSQLYFGPHQAVWRARLRAPLPGAQWTGITTRMAERLLERGLVDAVLTVKPAADDRWRPEPVLIRRASELAACRGMRMGYAPILSLIEPARAQGIKRLAVIGIPCQVYALRALAEQYGFEDLWVIGTPCSDNTTTENFHLFLEKLTDRPETVSYLEFRADYQVELRFDDGRQRLIPFLQLPLADLPQDFFPLTCRTCVDYVNALSDITVGYMGGEGQQWLIVRNAKGQQLVDLLGNELVLTNPTDSGNRSAAVRGFIENTRRAAGGLPLRRMPNWLRPLVGRLMTWFGPKGMEFARARIEMKAAETVIHLAREMPARLRSMMPDHVRRIASDLGLGADLRAVEHPRQPGDDLRKDK